MQSRFGDASPEEEGVGVDCVSRVSCSTMCCAVALLAVICMAMSMLTLDSSVLGSAVLQKYKAMCYFVSVASAWASVLLPSPVNWSPGALPLQFEKIHWQMLEAFLSFFHSFLFLSFLIFFFFFFSRGSKCRAGFVWAVNQKSRATCPWHGGDIVLPICSDSRLPQCLSLKLTWMFASLSFMHLLQFPNSRKSYSFELFHLKSGPCVVLLIWNFWLYIREPVAHLESGPWPTSVFHWLQKWRAETSC